MKLDLTLIIINCIDNIDSIDNQNKLDDYDDEVLTRVLPPTLPLGFLSLSLAWSCC